MCGLACLCVRSLLSPALTAGVWQVTQTQLPAQRSSLMMIQLLACVEIPQQWKPKPLRPSDQLIDRQEKSTATATMGRLWY